MERYKNNSNAQIIIGGKDDPYKAWIKAFKEILKKDLVNDNQCRNLFNNLVQNQVITLVYKLMELRKKDVGGNYLLVLCELLVIQNKSLSLVEKCGRANWCEEAIFQLQSKETF